MRSFVWSFLLPAAAACGGGGDGIVPGVAVFELSAPANPDLPCRATVDTDGDGETDQDWTYSYSPDGLVETDELRDLGGALVEEDEYTQDHAGHYIRFRTTTPDGSLVTAKVYDSFGRVLLATTDSDGDGSSDVTETYTAWTDAGQPLGSSTTANVGNYTTAYRYDDNGRLVSRLATFDGGGEYSARTVSYDDAAGTRTSTYSHRGHVAFSWAETFRDGLLVSWSIMEADGGTTVDSYTYDGGRLVMDVQTGPGVRTVTRYVYCSR